MGDGPTPMNTWPAQTGLILVYMYVCMHDMKLGIGKVGPERSLGGGVGGQILPKFVVCIYEILKELTKLLY